MASVYRHVRGHDRAPGGRLAHRRGLFVVRRNVRHRVQVSLLLR